MNRRRFDTVIFFILLGNRVKLNRCLSLRRFFHFYFSFFLTFCGLFIAPAALEYAFAKVVVAPALVVSEVDGEDGNRNDIASAREVKDPHCEPPHRVVHLRVVLAILQREQAVRCKQADHLVEYVQEVQFPFRERLHSQRKHEGDEIKQYEQLELKPLLTTNKHSHEKHSDPAYADEKEVQHSRATLQANVLHQGHVLFIPVLINAIGKSQALLSLQSQIVQDFLRHLILVLRLVLMLSLEG